MLTIGAMSDGKGYSARHLEHNDYYAAGERVVGEWFGRGAELIGLGGVVMCGRLRSHPTGTRSKHKRVRFPPNVTGMAEGYHNRQSGRTFAQMPKDGLLVDSAHPHGGRSNSRCFFSTHRHPAPWKNDLTPLPHSNQTTERNHPHGRAIALTPTRLNGLCPRDARSTN